MNCQTHRYLGQDPKLVARRWFFRQCGVGLGAIALGDLLRQAGFAAPANRDPLAVKQPHHAAKAKRVVFLFMAGAPSHLELFDYKPQLAKYDGTLPPPASARRLPRCLHQSQLEAARSEVQVRQTRTMRSRTIRIAAAPGDGR